MSRICAIILIAIFRDEPDLIILITIYLICFGRFTTLSNPKNSSFAMSIMPTFYMNSIYSDMFGNNYLNVTLILDRFWGFGGIMEFRRRMFGLI